MNKRVGDLSLRSGNKDAVMTNQKSRLRRNDEETSTDKTSVATTSGQKNKDALKLKSS
jgi:hypothetical protein